MWFTLEFRRTPAERWGQLAGRYSHEGAAEAALEQRRRGNDWEWRIVRQTLTTEVVGARAVHGPGLYPAEDPDDGTRLP